MKYCSQCGNPMDEDMRFCPKCGEQFKEVEGESPTNCSIPAVSNEQPKEAEVTPNHTQSTDPITSQILSLVKGIENMALPKLNAIKEKLQNFSKNKLFTASKKIQDLLTISLESVERQIALKKDSSPAENTAEDNGGDGRTVIAEQVESDEKVTVEVNHQDGTIDDAPQDSEKQSFMGAIATFIHAHPNAYFSVDKDTNKITVSKKAKNILIALAVALVVLIAFATPPNTPPSNNTGINVFPVDDSTINTENGNTDTVPTVPVTTNPPHNIVNIKIKCEANWFFNTYDLEVYLNNKHQYDIDHGTTEEFAVTLEDGTYTLTVSNKDDSAVKGEVTFTITDDTNIEYNVTCYGDKVTVTQEHFENMRPLTDSETKTPKDAKEYINKQYETVVEDLKAVGFTNIVTKELRDLEDSKKKNVGKVNSVAINGRTDFTDGEIFEKNVEILIIYHALEPSADEMKAKIENRSGTPAKEIIASFEGTGYTLVCCVQEKEIKDFNPEGYIFENGSINSAEKIARLNFTTEELIAQAEELAKFLPQETAIRVAVVAMTNGYADDIFKSDGNTYDTSKFHSYDDLSGFYLTVIDAGRWLAKDSKTWRVEDITYMLSGYSTYLIASMDITFDGTNYIASNVDSMITTEEFIKDENPFGTPDHWEPSENHPYLTVSPRLIKENRDATAEKKQNNKTMSTSERKEWIGEQFSSWDGQHKQLKEMIKDRLNDESSYKHTDTIHYDLTSQEMVDAINKVLKDAGYSQRVSLGDLFVVCEFTAKNAFNATIKNTAFAIVYYDINTIELVGIE